MKKLLSVVIPTFNPSELILEAVRSVLAQSDLDLSELEIIIVNDHSDKRESLKILYTLSSSPNIRLIHSETNGGPSASRNAGIKEAKGQYIGFLDDDDLWPVEKWDLQKAALDRDPELLLVSGQIQYFSHHNTEKPAIAYHVDDDKLYHVHMGACLMRSSLFSNGRHFFDEELRLSEDWDWWLKVKEACIPHLILDTPTLRYRVHQNNTSTHLNIHELGLLKVLNSSIKRRRKSGNRRLLSPHLGYSADYSVSVVLPLFNGARFIRRALDSIIAQSHSVDEIVVVDDGSTDSGAEIVLNEYPSARLIKQSNAGVANARNKGWKACHTSWIAFMDQDDEWMPDKIEKQIGLAQKDRKHDWVSCNQRYQSYNNNLPDFLRPALQTDHISHVPSSWLIRKSVLVSLNGFDEGYRYTSDLDLIRRYRATNGKDVYCAQTLLIKHITGENESRAMASMTKELFSVLRKQMQTNKV